MSKSCQAAPRKTNTNANKEENRSGSRICLVELTRRGANGAIGSQEAAAVTGRRLPLVLSPLAADEYKSAAREAGGERRVNTFSLATLK